MKNLVHEIIKEAKWVKQSQEDWMEKEVEHMTPSGQRTKVKVKSLPAAERKRYKPIGNQDDFHGMLKHMVNEKKKKDNPIKGGPRRDGTKVKHEHSGNLQRKSVQFIPKNNEQNVHSYEVMNELHHHLTKNMGFKHDEGTKSKRGKKFSYENDNVKIKVNHWRHQPSQGGKHYDAHEFTVHKKKPKK